MKLKPKHIKKAWLTKFKHWKYEEEHRVFIEKITPDKDEHYYVNFENNCVLREVILGCKTDLSRKDLQPFIGENEKEVFFGKVTPHESQFKMKILHV